MIPIKRLVKLRQKHGVGNSNNVGQNVGDLDGIKILPTDTACPGLRA